MTTQTAGTPLPEPHKTWWTAPFAASVFGLPVLATEYAVILDHDGMGQYGGMIYTALALYALAWVLPHRLSLRMPRILAAGAALLITLFPVGLLVLLAAMVSA
ncbi:MULTISPECIES: hypothetical protein [unclassified Streptomyces]|uniref:hypothetical protein n=1 Tax=unclassified Streptomyces TaxID=2593676 RepID=UPI00070F9F50|nr:MULTISPECIES: hypothetical protein [unclassified Streptomyces]KRC95893.1 hypothetical protein ASE41_09245 [Streptomyces sp. Root264]